MEEIFKISDDELTEINNVIFKDFIKRENIEVKNGDIVQVVPVDEQNPKYKFFNRQKWEYIVEEDDDGTLSLTHFQMLMVK